MPDQFDQEDLRAAYQEWVDLIPHISRVFRNLWNEKEIRADVDIDRLLVFWKFGFLGSIYFERGKVVFTSDARRNLRELDADVPDLEFHEAILPFRGWSSDEGVRSDIEYLIGWFWPQARQEAEIYQDAVTVTNAKLDI